MGRDGHACPGLLVYLREDRASHQRCDDASHCIFRTASGKTASIEAPGVFSGAGPSDARPGKDDRHIALAGAPARPERDEIELNHHRALALCLSMIFSENRFTLFRIML